MKLNFFFSFLAVLQTWRHSSSAVGQWCMCALWKPISSQSWTRRCCGKYLQTSLWTRVSIILHLSHNQKTLILVQNSRLWTKIHFWKIVVIFDQIFWAKIRNILGYFVIWNPNFSVRVGSKIQIHYFVSFSKNCFLNRKLRFRTVWYLLYWIIRIKNLKFRQIEVR